MEGSCAVVCADGSSSSSGGGGCGDDCSGGSSSAESSPSHSRCGGSLLLAAPSTAHSNSKSNTNKNNNNNKKGSDSPLFALCPEEVVHVLSFLDSSSDLCAAASTCRALRATVAAADALLWRQLCCNLWRDKSGYRRFAEAIQQDTLALRQYHESNVVRSTRRAVTQPSQQPQHPSQTLVLSPDSTLRCVRANILDPAVAKLAPPLVLPLSVVPSNAAAAAGEANATIRRLWWDLTPEEQARRLRRQVRRAALQVASLSGNSNSNSSDDESADDEHDDADDDATWKYAYFMSLRDAKRQSLTLDDLRCGTWTIAFRHIAGRSFPVVFREDGTLVTPLHAAGLRYQISQGGAQLNVHVFPALSVSRVAASPLVVGDGDEGEDDLRHQWAWRIKNFFVEIVSDDVPIPVYLQRLQRNCAPRPP